MTDAIYSNSFEGGTDGTTWTAPTSGGGSGTALTTAQGTGAVFIFSAAAACQGSLGLRMTIGSNASYVRGDDPRSDASPSLRGGMRRGFKYHSQPTATVFIGQVRTQTDANVVSATILNTGAIRIIVGASTTLYTSSTGLMTAGSLYNFELIYTPGASTTTATIEFRLAGNDDTQILAQTFTNVDVGTTDPAARFRFGGMSGTTGWTYDYMDSLRWGHKATGWFGPIANQLPVASVPPYQNLSTPGSTTVTVIASDSDGSISTYLWSRVANKSTASPALTNTTLATLNVASFTEGNLVTVQCIVTDNSGGAVTVVHEIRTPTDADAGIIDVVIDAPGDSGWTIYGGAASQNAALSDGSATTGVESPDLPSTALVHYWRYTPMEPRAALRILVDDTLQTASGSISNVKYRLVQGPDNTVIAEVAATALKDQASGSTSSLSLTNQDLYFDLTPTQVSSITDWGDLRPGVVVDD